MEEDAEVADGEARLRLEAGEVLPALGDDDRVALGVALEHVDLERGRGVQSSARRDGETDFPRRLGHKCHHPPH